MAATRRLHLLRHAKSSWTDPALADHDRPLSARGRKAARRIGRHLLEEGIRPDLALCSSSLRTRETFERLGIPPVAHVRFAEAVYAASAAGLLSLLRALPDDARSVLVIGHNPGLGDLVLLLASRGGDLPRVAERFPTGALATLEFEGVWSALGPGACSLERAVFPRELA